MTVTALARGGERISGPTTHTHTHTSFGASSAISTSAERVSASSPRRSPRGRDRFRREPTARRRAPRPALRLPRARWTASAFPSLARELEHVAPRVRAGSLQAIRSKRSPRRAAALALRNDLDRVEVLRPEYRDHGEAGVLGPRPEQPARRQSRDPRRQSQSAGKRARSGPSDRRRCARRRAASENTNGNRARGAFWALPERSHKPRRRRARGLLLLAIRVARRRPARWVAKEAGVGGPSASATGSRPLSRHGASLEDFCSREKQLRRNSRPSVPLVHELVSVVKLPERRVVQISRLIAASMCSAIASGVGGQPGMRMSTGSTSWTAPTSSAASPSRLQPRAQSPSAATRRGSGIAS